MKATSAEFLARHYLQPYPPKAARLIVTIYGDIVEPRGGVLWMGDLISLCAGFGVNESLVRTAVSRLVSKGQLKGEREGRRSFYALTEEARDEYHLAAELFFGPEDGDCGWLITHCSQPAAQAGLLRNGYVCLGGDVYAGADRPGRPIAGAAFRSVAIEPDGTNLRKLLQSAFRLDELGEDYRGFSARFQPMADDRQGELPEQAALLARLALVHDYRTIRLRDPRLPQSVMPADWPGHAAHRLFAELYRNLSPAADAYIGQHLLSRNGPLPACPQAVQARLGSLALRA